MWLPFRARRPDQRPARRWRRAVLVVLALFACATGPGLFIAARCALTTARPAAAASESSDIRAAKAAITGYSRAGSNTYLTLPEWFIVYNTEDYAAFIRRARPSGFPYFGSIVDVWTYYRRVCDASCAAFPFDRDYHMMIVIIGSSFAVENSVKGIYENTFGRLVEALAGHDSAEDTFAVRTAEEYGRFMHTIPWYEFPFGGKLRALWTENGAWGPHLLRKWERRFALSAEYGVKAGYAWLIRVATKSAYGDENPRTYIHAEHVPATPDGFPVERVRALADGSWILAIPRYEAFTPTLVTLTAQGMRVLDIAGNARVLVTALTPGNIPLPNPGARVLFARSLAADPPRRRIAIDVDVGALGDVLDALEKHGATLEHIYDF